MIITKIQEYYMFVPSKPFGSLLEIYPANHIFLKTFNSEYDEINVWFTDQNSQPLEIEDKINLTMVIKWHIKMGYSIEPRDRIYVKGYVNGSYSISDIQVYFEYIFKKHGEDINKPSVQIQVNKIENRVAFKIKNGSALELLTSETMKLLISTENKITKDKNGDNVPHLEITEVILIHCNIVNNDY